MTRQLKTRFYFEDSKVLQKEFNELEESIKSEWAILIIEAAAKFLINIKCVKDKA